MRRATATVVLAPVLAALIAGGAGAASPPPTLTIAKAAVDRAAGTVHLRVRICFSAGLRALISIDERRTVGGVVRASRRWVPRGVEPTRISPYACNDHWRLDWLLEGGLQGRGTYRATIRVRDAYGRWSPRASVSVTSA